MTRVIRRSALTRLKESYRANTQVLGPLSRHVMRKVGASGTDEDRRYDIVHPSAMAKSDWCGRHDYYVITGAPTKGPKSSNPSFTMENILTEGTNIHKKYQAWFWEMGVLFGWWSCRSCQNYWEDLSPNKCPQCSSSRIRYREVPLLNEKYLIGGHADGALHGLLVDTSVLIEIKSIGIRSLAFEAPRLYQQYVNGASSEYIWLQINRPFPSHLKQGMFYLWLSNGRYTEIIFIYESKFNQRVKEFRVKYNPTLISDRLAEAKEVAQGVRSGISPDHPEWAASDGPVCKSCAYRSICWSLKEINGTDYKAAAKPIPVIRTASAKRKRALSKT